MVNKIRNHKHIWLMGGLGNILFQGFAAHILSVKGYNVRLNKYLINKNFVTKFILKWKIHINLSELVFKNNFELYERFSIVFFVKTLINRLFNYNIFDVYEFSAQKDFDENCNDFFGYFQDKKFILENLNFFKDYLKVIRKNLVENNPNNNIVVHFRGTDSTWSKEYSHYYSHVIKEINCLYVNEKVTIVTDDIIKAKFFFKKIKKKVVISKSLNQDLNIMCNAKVFFSGLSTLSWWAANLNENASRIYIPQFLDNKLGLFNDNCKIIKL
jgi:hypothetical protein